ncbi:hypothetical protein [Enhygromyxa salina]|uniref:Uncharacterized protein n=1 Tax=Enhygromyxa salina TaxID=215803 RepID=A0A2S9YT81_9BACT|nr:hypothetical protein [Enhygromyxa salina]PRQ08249.1 hypothetical protein ENSA7_18710 [Enhygromyxa salina]
MSRRTLIFPCALAVLACSPDTNDESSVFTSADAGVTFGATADESGTQGSGATNGDGDGDGDGDPGDGDGDGDTDGGPKLDVLPADTGVDDGPGGDEGCQYIDVLFIVDISASMSEEKANLNANFPSFVQVLDDYVNDPMTAALGYRLGLTNSSIVNNLDGQSTFGLDGALYDGQGGGGLWPNCDMQGKLWIDGPAPSVSDTFSCAAPLPKSSCNNCSDIGKERPLDTIEQFIAKSGPGGVNEGFYRGDQSLFVIVILTDEDDDANNTTTTPADTKFTLDEFAQGEDRYVIVTIAGPQNGSCNSNFGSATAAPSLHAFTNLAPNGVLGDICQGDLSQALDQALSVIQDSCDELPPPVG